MGEALANIRETQRIIRAHGLYAKKKYGQNFLIDRGVLLAIVEGARVTKDDTVLEIGPGIGTLTRELSEAAKAVVAVEIDKALIPVLDETLADCGNVTVINADILDIDLQKLSEEHNGGAPFKIVANLPYYISTPIVMKLLGAGSKPASVTVMVQKEMADRMCARPGTKAYGALSLIVQYYADPETVANVPPHSFYPQPDVESAVLHLIPHEKPPVETKDPEAMMALIRASFSKRRKTLVNAVSAEPSLPYTKETLSDALKSMGLDTNIRGEALTLSDYAELTRILTKE